MTAEILKGKDIAAPIQEQIVRDVEAVKSKFKVTPKLVVLKAADEHASDIYLKNQKKKAESLGLEYELKEFNSSKGEEDFIQVIQALNKDDSVHGMMIQLPLPDGWDADKLHGILNPQKDVEGVSPQNLGLLTIKKEVIVPCTAQAVMEILKTSGVKLYGAEVVIVGSSFIVGRPVAMLLMKERASVHVLGSASSKLGTLEGHVRNADIVIACSGQPHLVKGGWIKEGAVVVDVGINYFDGKTVGDVDTEEASKRASQITPVPGGVGPLTVTILMQNLIKAFYWQNSPK
jgi:methylenetetrahydrofolate dehydrogenase (NADP+)/methenyltetrahydrofolate cyclohydrolase